MRYRVSEFKLLERGFKDTIVLIPGWATDYRIFATLNLNYNYLLPTKFYPLTFKDSLLKFLNQESIDKIALFGWSLGSFLAVEFVLSNLNRVGELVLLGIRKRFDPKTLEEAKRQLMKNKKAYLYKFYLECFSDSDKEGLVWFKNNLLKNYIREMELEDLICALDYLLQAQINQEPLASVKNIRIFHGLEDKIAPIEEAEEIKSYLSQAKFIYMPGVGHIPFLNQGFKENFNNG